LLPNPSMFQRKLKALGASDWQNFHIQDQSQFRKTVMWLEEARIRLYPVEQRAGLREINSPEWDKAFLKYLEDLSCAQPYGPNMTPKQLNVVFDALLSQAITAEYADHASQYNAIKTSDVLQRKQAETKTDTATAIDCSSEQFQRGVAELATMLQLPSSSQTEPAAVLNVIKKRIETLRLKEEETKQSSGASSEQDLKEALSHLSALPTGFGSTGDAIVDKAVCVLRLLYINDLRDLQNHINDMLVYMQEYTANPITDKRLGQVGR